MSKKQIRLVSIGVTSYARINKEYKADVQYPDGVDVTEELKKVDGENGVVIVFPNGFRFQQSEGDQGTGKSSLQKALLELTGNILPPNAINSIDNDKKANIKVIGLDGFLYHIRATKSTYVIERIETDPETGEPILNDKGKEIKAEMKAPKDLIKKIVGPAGISPQWLAEMKPADQVTWLRSLYSLDQDILKQEVAIKKDYDTNYKSRTTAGNEHKRYKALVEASPFYKDQATHDKYFKETNFDDVEEKFKVAQENYTTYQRYEMGLKQLKEVSLANATNDVLRAEEEIKTIEEQIRQLQEKLSRAHDTKQQKVEAKIVIENRITEGDKWMEDNAKTKEEYEGFAQKITEATNFKANKQEYELMLANQKQMNHFSDEYTRLTHRLDELAKAKQQLIELFSPKIDGFEVCIPDEEEKREGLFYKGLSLDKLSESELWEMATQLWEQLNVQMVFVENINSLGTGAVAKFNQFIEQGGYVFATMMNREEKNLKITFAEKIK